MGADQDSVPSPAAIRDSSASSAAPESPTPASRAFVGRRQELRILHAAVDEATAGRGRLLLLAGEPGVGKTCTAEEVVAYARRRGAQVLWSRCYESEGAPAFWPWIQIVRAGIKDVSPDELAAALGPDTADLATLVPAIRDRVPGGTRPPVPESSEARFRLFDTVVRVMEFLARRAPLVAVIDDLHGADPSSLLLLQFLSAHLRAMPLLLVATFRNVGMAADHPLSATLVEVMRESGTEQVTLRGLSESEVAQFVQMSTGIAPAPALVAALYRHTEGNPLFLGEFVRMLVAEEHQAALADPYPALVIPSGVKAAIARRLAPLSSACRRFLAVAAVVGREFPSFVVQGALAGLLAATGAAASDAVEDLIAEAVVPGVIVEMQDTRRLRFSHALVRETLYEALQPAERAKLHGYVAEAMAVLPDAGEHLSELAYHFSQADRAGADLDAIDYARRAGDRALELRAYEEAARLYQLGVTVLERRHSQAQPASLGELLLGLGAAQNSMGDLAAGKDTFLRAADVARRLGDRELLSRAALGYAGEMAFPEVGYLDHAHLALLEEPLAAWADDDHRLHARLLGRLATALYFTDAAERRAELCARSIAMARRLGERRTLAQVLLLAHAATWGPNPHERLEIANELMQLSRELDDRGLAYAAHHWRFCDLFELGDRAAVDAEAARCRALAAELRQPYQTSWVSIFTGALDALEGRFDGAERAANDVLQRGKWLGRAVEPIFAIQMFVLRNLQGRQEEIVDIIRMALTMNPGIPALRAALAVLLIESGQPAAAHEEAAGMVDALERLPRDLNFVPTVAHLGQVCALAGDRERAGIVYERLRLYDGLSLVIGNGVGYFGTVSHYLGIIALSREQIEPALQHFEAALASYERMRAHPWTALARCESAAAFAARAGAGDRERALERAGAALGAARALGMRALETRAARLTESLQTPLRGVGSPQTLSGEDTPSRCRFRKDVGMWEIAYAGRTAHLKDSRGMQLVAYLLPRPDVEVHVLDLVQVSGGAKAYTTGESRTPPAPGLTALDTRAKDEYRRRLRELRGELEEAERCNDPGAVERARVEIEMLEEQLTGAVGLGGRDRRTSDDAERARVAVTKRIKEAILAVRTVHPALGDHLRATISTGTFCAYTPSKPAPTWDVG